MNLSIPELSLVVLIGPSGSGKSTFARKHFLPTEILSSDSCRGWVADDENDQSATPAAFEVLHFIAAKRLERGKLTVIDATNVQPEARKSLVALAREYHVIPVAVVLNLPERICHDRNEGRSDRAFGPYVIQNQMNQMRKSLRGLEREGFRHVHRLDSVEQVDAVQFKREVLWNDRRAENGPFDIIGDIHGCGDELEDLLGNLGYLRNPASWAYVHPDGRRLIFVGDIVDRGPRVLDCYRIVRESMEAGSAICVPGNHEAKLMKWLNGKNVQITHGLEQSIAEIEALPAEIREPFKKELAEWIRSLVSHYVFDGGSLVVAHAGMKASMQGRGSAKVREFALYGETTGETDEFGLLVRHNWAAEYRGSAMVVYGHTPVPEPTWLNRTINIDTGCVFGGKLTALRYPEKELVAVPARRTYAEARKPFLSHEADSTSLSAQQTEDDLLDINDVSGKRIIRTRLRDSITVLEENGRAALEIMSRFAVNPKWLIYLPPTMSPCETSALPDYLEYPTEAFDHYRKRGVKSVICEEKHMGSRAIVVVCKDEEVAQRRFGIQGEGQGCVYTRTGRAFFRDKAIEQQLLARVVAAANAGGLWDQLGSDWICLDTELMPWSAKARELLIDQYAPVARAGQAFSTAALGLLDRAGNQPELAALRSRMATRGEALSNYSGAYRRYCWSSDGIDNLRLAPFHLLASENAVHADKDHPWHLAMIGQLCNAGGPLLFSTKIIEVDLESEPSCTDAVQWWLDLTASGGEGMVIKPRDFISRGKRDLNQPALKVRGREYLRLIYGPEYNLPGNLDRLRGRALKSKRSLALREFALGIESLERFVRREPLRSVHEAVFAVLALESEPIDPRL